MNIDSESYAAMNFWRFSAKEGCVPMYLDVPKQDFVNFFKNTVPSNPLKEGYLLPTHIGVLLREGKVTVKVLETRDS